MIKNFFVSALIASCLTAVAAATSANIKQEPIDLEAGIRVPAGFKATVYADKIGQITHLQAADNGWIYGALKRPKKKMGAVALYDGDGDGVAEQVEYFAPGVRGTGTGIYDGYFYYGTKVSIIRWKIPAEGGVPTEQPELVAHGFGAKRQNSAKAFTFDGKGGLYVDVGAPSNACQERTRSKGSPGMDPCPILEEYGGIWKFDAATLMQHLTETATQYATGLRHAIAVDWNPVVDSLYIVQQGRDQLAELFPENYTLEESADLPAEEFHRVPEGADLGWPYSYFDQRTGHRMQMPEYGGDGKAVSDKGQKPIIGFPAHWAASDLIFKRNAGMPEKYSKGAFVAFQGSWDRLPLPQSGYSVVFAPLDSEGNPSGDWVTFADGFAGREFIENPRQARYRPTGLAEGKSGELYVSSAASGGRIWRISYVGE